MLIQVKIIIDVIGPTWKVSCGYNLCTGDGVMEDARKLGEKNCRNAARNRHCGSFWRRPWLKRGCCANDDDDDDDDGVRLAWPCKFRFCPMPPHVLVDFVVLPPGHGRSVNDFWVWDAQEAQLRCPDDVSGDRGVPGGPLNLNSTNLPTPWSPRESYPSGKIPTVEPGIEPGNSWLVVGASDH